MDAAASSNRFTNANIMYHINEAQNDFARRTKCLEKATTFNTAVGTREYNVPTDFFESRLLVYDFLGERRLMYPTVNLNADAVSDSDGRPEIYAVWGDKFVLYPTPTSIQQMYVRYWATPALLVASDPNMTVGERAVIPEIPARYHFDIVTGAAASIFAAFEDTTQYTTYQSRYEERIKKAQQEMALRYDGDPMSPYSGDLDFHVHSVPDVGCYDCI